MSKTLSQLLQERFGVKTTYRENPKVSTVGVTAVQIVSYNPNRLGLVVINLSTNNMYVSPWLDVSSTKGILLAPLGGSLSLIWDEDYEFTANEFYAVAAAAASAIYCLEVYAVE